MLLGDSEAGEPELRDVDPYVLCNAAKKMGLPERPFGRDPLPGKGTSWPPHKISLLEEAFPHYVRGRVLCTEIPDEALPHEEVPRKYIVLDAAAMEARYDDEPIYSAEPTFRGELQV